MNCQSCNSSNTWTGVTTLPTGFNAIRLVCNNCNHIQLLRVEKNVSTPLHTQKSISKPDIIHS